MPSFVYVFFAVGGLEHHALQVGTGIGFGQVHRHRLAGAHAGDKAGTLVVVAELIEGLDAVLQGPDVFETGVCSGDHFVDGRVGGNREVQAAKAARHRDAVEASLAGGFQVLVGLACVAHAAVFAVGALGVHVFGVGEDGVGGDVASHFEHAVVVVHRVGKIFRRVVKAVLVGVAVFLELHDALHQGMAFEVEWGHPRKNPSEKFGCDTSRKFVTRLGKDLQYSPSLVPSCTRSRSNFLTKYFSSAAGISG